MFPHSHVHQSVLFALLGWFTKGTHEAIDRTCSCIFEPVTHCVSESSARGKINKAGGST